MKGNMKHTTRYLIILLTTFVSLQALAEYDDAPVNLGPASRNKTPLFSVPTSGTTTGKPSVLGSNGVREINSFDNPNWNTTTGTTSNEQITKATDTLIAAVEACTAAMEAKGASGDYCMKALPMVLNGGPMPAEAPKKEMDPMMLMMMMQSMGGGQGGQSGGMDPMMLMMMLGNK